METETKGAMAVEELAVLDVPVQERRETLEEAMDRAGKAKKPAGTSRKKRGASVQGHSRGEHNAELGRRGEDAAARFLYRHGYDIVERNWTCAAGEADIIARDGDALVFVEVKTRSNCDKGLPSEAVNSEKRARYEQIAACFLQEYEVVDIEVRFDVIALVVISPDRALIRHHICAFVTD